MSYFTTIYCKTGKFRLHFIFTQFTLRGRGRIQQGAENFEEIYDNKFRPTIHISAAGVDNGKNDLSLNGTDTQLNYRQCLTSSLTTIVFFVYFHNKNVIKLVEKTTLSNSKFACHI